MSQNSITAAALIIAFMIFITVRGELPYYFGTLGLGSVPEQPIPGSTAGITSGFLPSTGTGTGTTNVSIGGGGIKVTPPPINIGGPGGVTIGLPGISL